MAVAIASDLIDEIVEAAERSPGVEVCGLLLSADRHRPGSVTLVSDARQLDGREPAVTTIGEVVPCANVAADPRRWFEIDPAALLAAHRAARRGAPAVVGHYHSHPSGDPIPSPRDAADAAPDGSIWLIVGLVGGRAQVRAYRAGPDGALHGRFDPVALRVAR